MKRTILMLMIGLSLSHVVLGDNDDDLKKKYIGTASIDANGVISLNLWSRDPDVGGAMLLIRKSDPEYNDVLKHMNGPKIGKWTMVEPWPLKKDKGKSTEVSPSK